MLKSCIRDLRWQPSGLRHSEFKDASSLGFRSVRALRAATFLFQHPRLEGNRFAPNPLRLCKTNPCWSPSVRYYEKRVEWVQPVLVFLPPSTVGRPAKQPLCGKLPYVPCLARRRTCCGSMDPRVGMDRLGRNGLPLSPLGRLAPSILRAFRQLLSLAARHTHHPFLGWLG